MMDDTELRPGDPSRYTLLLGEDGNASLRADCNRARGRYRLEGARLELGPLATTRAMCPPGSLFDRYTRLLGIAVSWQLTGDGQLAIATSVDSGILFFRRAP